MAKKITNVSKLDQKGANDLVKKYGNDNIDSVELYKKTGHLVYNAEPKSLKYSYSFAELLDRAGIVLMKIANAFDSKAFEAELADILNDIQIHLDQKPMDAEQVKGLIVLTQVNLFIWGNEKAVRDADDGKITDEELLPMLKESHKANSLRGEAKKHIQIQRRSRTDEKLNYGRTSGFWNIDFNRKVVMGENEQWCYM